MIAKTQGTKKQPWDDLFDYKDYKVSRVRIVRKLYVCNRLSYACSYRDKDPLNMKDTN